MRLALVVVGTVQGVGFRPFVRRTALAHRLTGFVRNGRDAVRIEVQGEPSSVAAFTLALEHEHPAAARIRKIEQTRVAEQRDDTAFEIVASDHGAAVAPLLPPDLATCGECWSDVGEVGDRRYRYPFTNCVSCGPRYSIVLGLPYDRPNTSMRAFAMCEDCSREYGDVEDRRYHAQPIACPRCGPSLFWCDRTGFVHARGEDALGYAVDLVRAGGILALRGLGGFQLVCDATDPNAVETLRDRKRRPHKPFAAMFRDLADLSANADVSDIDRRALLSPEAPIVLVTRRRAGALAEAVARGSPYVGAMLPYTPLHGLILEAVRGPIVCTSGNLSEEPICTNNDDAFARLGEIADGFLCHDRPIVRPVDDSVVRVSSRRTVVFRRARGYAPRTLARVDPRASVLALGAHMKNTVSLACRGSVVASQHLGDLDSVSTRDLLAATITDLLAFFDMRPRLLACDLHPDYASSVVAERLSTLWRIPLLRVQHHHAHIAACIAEHDKGEEAVLGLAWDGTGSGADSTVWGGEALVCRGSTYERVAHLRPFPLPGGDAAARDPRRVALGLLFAFLPSGLEGWANRWFGQDATAHLRALELRINSPACSSVGRLFDGVAALVGLDQRTTFEGQAGMRLEQLAAAASSDGCRGYPLPLRTSPGRASVADTAPLIQAVLADIDRGVDRTLIARRFHDALIELGVAIAEQTGIRQVALGGGCFQNHLLADGLESRLERAGFEVLACGEVPPNDGGISVGQAWLASKDPRSWG